MERINEENYEIFFLDYHEGKLTSEQVEELMIFLDEHPYLREEFEEMEMLKLTPPKAKYPNKKELLKGQLPNLVNQSNFDTYFIAAYEGDLTRRELDLVDQFIKDNGLVVGHYKDYEQVKLVPDYALVFNDKTELLRTKSKVLTMYHYGVGVAASLMFFAFTQFAYFGSEDVNQYADSDFAKVNKLRRELKATYAKGIVPVNARLVSYISPESVETDESNDDIIRMIKSNRNKQFIDGESFDNVLMIEETPVEDIKPIASKDIYLQTPSSATNKLSLLRFDPQVFKTQNFLLDGKKNMADGNKKVLDGIRDNAKEAFSNVFGVPKQDLENMAKLHGNLEDLPGTKQSFIGKVMDKVSDLTSKISGKGVQIQAATDEEGSEYNLKLGKIGVGFKRRKN